MHKRLGSHNWETSVKACMSSRLSLSLQDYISDVANVLQREESEDFILECVGILGNLTITDLDYELLLTEYSLVPWIKSKIQPGEGTGTVVMGSIL